MDKGLQGCIGEMDVGKIKTSISVDEELWKKFSISVLKKEGNRKLSEVVENLMKKYIKNSR